MTGTKDEWALDYDRFVAGGMDHKAAIQWANARDHERAGKRLNPISSAELIAATSSPNVRDAVSVRGTGRH